MALHKASKTVYKVQSKSFWLILACRHDVLPPSRFPSLHFLEQEVASHEAPAKDSLPKKSSQCTEKEVGEEKLQPRQHPEVESRGRRGGGGAVALPVRDVATAGRDGGNAGIPLSHHPRGCWGDDRC